MFHTRLMPHYTPERLFIVIPWRGFRCFTQHCRFGEPRDRHRAIVIPWRGFRCFTLRAEHNLEYVMIWETIVIPWRGFRCFTHTLAFDIETQPLFRYHCNPLAGI